MNLDRSLDDKFCLNILCYSMGNTTEEFFDKIVTLLNKAVVFTALSPFYQNDLKEKGKAAMPARDWGRGWIRCKYYVQKPAIDWVECQIYYKCHASLVILNLEGYDTKNFNDDWNKVMKNKLNDQITPVRLLFFNANPEQLKFFQEINWNIVIPSSEDEEKLLAFLRGEVEILIHSTALYFYEEIDKLKQDNHVIPVHNIQEEPLKDSSKAKKRKKGRSIKTCGDMALILCCHKDANSYYLPAYDLLESTDDYLWMAKIKEAQAAGLYLEFLFTERNQVTYQALSQTIAAVIKKMEGASNYFRKAKSPKSQDFDKECFFKLLRILKDLSAQNQFTDFVHFYADTVKKVPLDEEHYKILLKIASFFYEMRMYRKAGFFLKVVGDTILQDNFNADLARDIYLCCFPLFNIPLSKEILPDNFPKNDFLKIIDNNPDISKEIKRISPFLQLQLVNDVLALSHNDVPLQTKIISIILHYFLQDINHYTQQKLFNHLISLGNTLNKNLKLDLTYLPEVVRISPISEVLKVNIRQHEGGVDKGNIFIYNPWKKGGAQIADYNWMVDSVCVVKVFLRNVFEFEIFLDMIMLVTEGVKTITYPTSVMMRKTKSLQELTLKFKPQQTGTINVLGVISKLSNFVHFHPINAKGITIKNYNELNTAKDVIGIKNVPIKEKISTLKAYFEDTREEMCLYEGSLFCIRVIIDNKNDISVCLRKVLVSFAFADNSTLDKEVAVNGNEIKGYEQLSLLICRTVPEEEHFIKDRFTLQNFLLLNVYDIQNINKLFKIYVKVIYYEKEKPNISIEDNLTKEVKIVKGLSVGGLQINTSIPPDQITIAGKNYQHISVEDNFYIALDIVRDDPQNNKNDYMLSVYLKGVHRPIAEKPMSMGLNTVKVIAKASRELLKGEKGDLKNVKALFYGKWKEMNSLETGYLQLDNVGVNLLTENIVNQRVQLAIENNIEKKGDTHEALIGEFYIFTVRVKLLEQGKKKLFASLLVSEDHDLETALITKNEKGVIYKGKKSYLVEVEEGKEVSFDVKVMFMNNKEFQVFCFAADEETSTVYSYKYPGYIKAQ